MARKFIFFGKLIDNCKHTFTSTQRKISKFVLDNHNLIYNMTLSELAARLGVSESTVIRFIRRLGIHSYTDFRNIIRDYSRFVSNPGLKIDETKNKVERKNIISSVASSDADLIIKTALKILKTDFDYAVNLLSHADKIYVSCEARDMPLALLLYNNLSVIKDSVFLIEQRSPRAVSFRKGDVLIAFNLTRESVFLNGLCEFAKQNEAEIISFITSTQSKVSGFSTISFIIETDPRAFTDSIVGAVSLINALTIEITNRFERQAKNRLENIEKLFGN